MPDPVRRFAAARARVLGRGRGCSSSRILAAATYPDSSFDTFLIYIYKRNFEIYANGSLHLIFKAMLAVVRQQRTLAYRSCAYQH